MGRDVYALHWVASLDRLMSGIQRIRHSTLSFGCSSKLTWDVTSLHQCIDWDKIPIFSKNSIWGLPLAKAIPRMRLYAEYTQLHIWRVYMAVVQRAPCSLLQSSAFFHPWNFVNKEPLQSRGERIVFWWPNTNMKIIRLFKNERKQILFDLKKATEYE